MPRRLCVLCLVGLMASSSAGDKTRRVLQMKLRRGQRFLGTNTVSYSVTTKFRQGDKNWSTSESVQVTERFKDKVLRSGTRGLLEVERSYLLHYTKHRASEQDRPHVEQSALQGRKVVLRERRRRREVKLDGPGAVDPIVRNTAGIEIDWRDIFPDDAVAPGDTWTADAVALSRRLAAYLDSGKRGKMQVRFEEVVDGQAKFYVDWTLEGMRNRNLFTKVTLAGDVFFDLKLKRVVNVDLTGNIVVRGAIIGEGQPRIVKGEGKVSLKTTVKVAPVEASAEDEDR
ncbi:MAG: hypothetical protein ACYTDU_04820 [Planctomycetota bacterium]|jgi:hypothetical protein